MGEILQIFSAIFLIVSGIGMVGLIFFSLNRKLLSGDLRVIIGVIIGGLTLAFLFLFLATQLDDFVKISLLRQVCRFYGMTTILISLLSTIAVMIIAKDEESNPVVYILVPAAIVYILVGYFLIWYGDYASDRLILFWFFASGVTFVVVSVVALVALLIDGLSETIDFNKKYLITSIFLAITLGITMFVLYTFQSAS